MRLPRSNGVADARLRPVMRQKHPPALLVLAACLAPALLALSCRSSRVPIPDEFALANRPSASEERLVAAFHEAYAARYDAALEEIDRLAAENPDDPEPDLARAHVECLRALLSGDILADDPSVRSMTDSAEAALAKAEARLAADPADVRALRARGFARSYVARAHVITGSTLKAVWHAQGGAADLAASLRATAEEERDADPYLFLGFFHYMSGLSPSFVRAVGSVLNLTADCDLGLREIEHAAAHGVLYRDEAKLTLAFLSLLDREADYARSLDLLLDLTRRFPDNPGFALVLFMAQRRVEDYAAAEATLRRILARDPASTPEPIRLGTRVVLAGLLAELNRFDESETILASLLEERSESAERVRARLHLALGSIAERRGDRAGAEALYREAESAIANALRWDQESLKREVKSRLEKPLTPDEIELRFIQGEELRGDPASALALADRMADRLAGESAPDDPAAAELRYRRGRAAAKLGRREEAEADFRAAAGASSATAKVRGAARFELGKLLVEAGRSKEGRDELEALTRADTESADLRSRSLARRWLLVAPASLPVPVPVLRAPGRGPDNR